VAFLFVGGGIGIRTPTYARKSLPSPPAKLADCAYRLWRYIAKRGEQSLTTHQSGTITADYAPSGKLCILR